MQAACIAWDGKNAPGCSAKALPFSQSKALKGSNRKWIILSTGPHRNAKGISTNPNSVKFLIFRMDKNSNRIKQSECVCVCVCWGRAAGIWGKLHFIFFSFARFHCEHVMVFTEALCYFKVNLLTSECIISFVIVINYITVISGGKMEGNAQSKSARTACWLGC